MYSYSGEPASQMDAHYMDAQIADHLATVAAGIPSSLHHRGKQVTNTGVHRLLHYLGNYSRCSQVVTLSWKSGN